MEVKELQSLGNELISKIDEKQDISRTEVLTMSQLVEEFGELAKEVNRKDLRGQDFLKENLADEFADVFLQFSKLISQFNLDLEKSVLDKIEVLNKRHGLD